MTRELFAMLKEASGLARGGGGPRMRRLLAEIDLLRAALTVASVEISDERELENLALLVRGVRLEALELNRDFQLTREAAAQMMD